MTAGPRVLVFAMLLFACADGQPLPRPGESGPVQSPRPTGPGEVQSVPTRSQQVLRLPQDQCVQAVRKWAREEERRKFMCDSVLTDHCFIMYRNRMELLRQQERLESAKCLG
jgi:hypothetical protein